MAYSEGLNSLANQRVYEQPAAIRRYLRRENFCAAGKNRTYVQQNWSQAQRKPISSGSGPDLMYPNLNQID